MAKRISELIRMEPLLISNDTAAATSHYKVRIDGGLKNDLAVVCGVRCNSTGAIAVGVSGTAANYVQFSIIEGTAASVAGSAVSGATCTLGAATAATIRGAVNCLLAVTTDLSSAVSVTINGIQYQTTAVGATAVNGGQKLANAINGSGTSMKLPHYRAVGNFSAKTGVLIEPDDDKGTGLTIVTTAAASTIAPTMLNLQGIIEISLDRLSTNTPKYIGVAVSTFNGATSANYAFLVRQPSASPAFPGRAISLMGT